jgi:hypothetical protein
MLTWETSIYQITIIQNMLDGRDILPMESDRRIDNPVKLRG